MLVIWFQIPEIAFRNPSFVFHKCKNAAVNAAIAATATPAGDTIAFNIPPILPSPPLTTEEIAFHMPPEPTTNRFAIDGKFANA